MVTDTSGNRGIALVLVLLALSMTAAVGFGIALAASLSRMTAATAEESLALLNAAEAALDLAARDLALFDLDDVLRGAATSPRTDGAPGPRTVAPGVTINLVTLTNRLTCGRAMSCTAGQIREATADRPWGFNNPRWRLFLHGTLHPLPLTSSSGGAYVIVWIGDDAREDDDDPATDGEGAGHEGRYIVRARAEAFGPRGGRRAIEAELIRRCATESGSEVCIPGSRVQAWRATTQVP